ncbi:MAG: putative DNA-binding domain-containing protein [Hyphomicrobium sp.]|jgi:hypothetical protein
MTDKREGKHTVPPTLRELQALMQAAILRGDDALLAQLTDGAHASRKTLLGVYRHAYMARLVEVLSNEYPVLRRYMGEEPFRALARAFLTAHPSRTQNARWVGRSLPEFARQHWAERARPEVAELGEIERAVSDAFDSADAPILRFADLAAIEPGAWGQLTLELHPSVRLLHGETNAFDIWKALKDDAPAPPLQRPDQPEHWIVWRNGTTPKVRPMPYEEAMMCEEASRGSTFGALCQMLATYDDPDNAPLRAAQYLGAWVESEMLTAAKLAARPEPLLRDRQRHPA